MQPFDTSLVSRSLWRGALLLLVALTLCACASSPKKVPKNIERKHETGFSITQEIRVSGRVRSNFEKAMELLEHDRVEEGAVLLEKVVADAPQVTTAHIDLAIAYGRLGTPDDLAKAESSLERALELSPRHPVAHNELGIIYRRTGRFDAARERYLRALDVYPDFHFARRNLAILCDMYLTDMSCALEHYELYAKAVPNDEQAAIWIADLRNRLGR
jgi:Flp pilus assembly protein TadD